MKTGLPLPRRLPVRPMVLESNVNKRNTSAALLLLCLTLCGGCDKDDVAAPAGPSLVLIDSVDLAVPEPSGLALDLDGNHLWTVSDQTGNVYRLSIGGSLVETLTVGGQDLEGIAVDPVDGTLFITEEGRGEVLHLDREGNLLETLSPAGLPAMGNQGLEGITINPDSGNIFLLKESGPGLLVKMGRDGTVLDTFELDFAADYSGLAFDVAAGQLVVISDQAESLTWCTLDGLPIKTFSTGLDKGEGIALDPVRSVFYAVSDSRETLSTFQISE